MQISWHVTSMSNKDAVDHCKAFLDQKREVCQKRTKLLEDELFRIIQVVGGKKENLSAEDQAVTEEEWIRRGNTVLAKSIAPMSTLNHSDEEAVKPENLYR